MHTNLFFIIVTGIGHCAHRAHAHTTFHTKHNATRNTIFVIVILSSLSVLVFFRFHSRLEFAISFPYVLFPFYLFLSTRVELQRNAMCAVCARVVFPLILIKALLGCTHSGTAHGSFLIMC